MIAAMVILALLAFLVLFLYVIKKSKKTYLFTDQREKALELLVGLIIVNSFITNRLVVEKYADVFHDWAWSSHFLILGFFAVWVTFSNAYLIYVFWSDLSTPFSKTRAKSVPEPMYRNAPHE